MAAVVEKSNWCKLLLALSILLTLSFSQGFIDEGPLTRFTFLEVSGTDGTITATLKNETLTYHVSQERAKLEEAYKLAQKGNQGGSQQVIPAGLKPYLEDIQAHATPFPGASIYFYYIQRLDSGGHIVNERIYIEKCNPATTDQDGVAVCVLDPELYKETCKEIYVSFGDEIHGAQYKENYKSSFEKIVICGKDAGSLFMMGKWIEESFTNNADTPICFISILLAGLLLASMFFAGRSPLSLLDLTTPLLPKAKTISYGGISMGVGFARMTREMARMQGRLGNSAVKTFAEMRSTRRMRNLIAKDRGERVKDMLKMIDDSKAGSVFKMMALRAVLAGRNLTAIKRILKLAELKADPSKKKEYMEKYGKTFAELSDLEDPEIGENNLHDRVLQLSKMYVLNDMEMEAFGSATGSVWPILKTPRRWIQDYVPTVGMHLSAAVASMFFATRHVARMYRQAIVRTPIRTIDRWVTKGKITKKVKMAVGDKTGKVGKKTRWLASQIAEPHELETVRLYNIFEKGAADYRRLMLEAKRDVIHWLMGRIFDQCGIKSNLSRDEVMMVGLNRTKADGKTANWSGGPEEGTPEELLFSKINDSRFKAIEKELRRILAGKGDELEKARRIMVLMDKSRITFDGTGVNTAINRLSDIDSSLPPNFVGADYGAGERGDKARQSIIDSHKYFRLRRYLEDSFGVDTLMDLTELDNQEKFYFSVGRNELTYGKSDHTFGTFFRSRYREALEASDPEARNPIGIRDVANYAFLRIVNERWGILDPATKGIRLDRDVQAVMLKAQRWLQALANPEAFFKIGKDHTNLSDLISQFYHSGAREVGKKNIFGEDAGGDMMQWNMHGEEYGPLKGMWRMNMKAHWRTMGGPMVAGKSSVEHQAHGEVYSSHQVPLAVQRMLYTSREGPKKGLKYKEAMEKYKNDVVVPSLLFGRLKQIMEQDNPNTYFTSQGEFERFRTMLSSYRARIAENRNKAEGLTRSSRIDPAQITDKEVLEYIRIPLSITDISKDTWLRLREGSYVPFVSDYTYPLGQADRPVNTKYYVKNAGRWEEFSPHKLLADRPIREVFGAEKRRLHHAEIKGLSAEVRKQYAEVMDSFRETGTARAENVRGLLDRLGSIAHKKSGKASACGAMVFQMYSQFGDQLRAIGVTLENARTKFTGTKVPDQLRIELLMHQYHEASTIDSKRYAAEELKSWAKQAPRENRKAKVALLFYESANGSGDWTDFNNYTEAVRLMPGAMDLPGEMKGVDMKEATGVTGWVKSLLPTLHDYTTKPFFKAANVGYENYMMGLFGKQTRNEYEGSIISEYFRETGAQFAGKLAAGEYGRVDHSRPGASPSMKAYNKLMDSFVRYHAVWDETITRDPRGNSSAIGTAFIFSGFFHMGPATAYGSGPYQRTTFPGFKTSWAERWLSPSKLVAGFKGLQWTPQVFNWAIGSPFILAYRTYITSRWGFLSKYDRMYKDSLGAGGYGFSYEEERAEELDKEHTHGEPDSLGARERYTDLHEKQTQAYDHHLREYQKELEERRKERRKELRDKGMDAVRAAEQARDQARDELQAFKPQMPAFELQRDTLNAFHQTGPRQWDARRAMWSVGQYSSFDPSAASWGKMWRIAATSPLSPVHFIPWQGLQRHIMNKGTFIMGRTNLDNAPYNAQSTSWFRRAIMLNRGHMTQTEYAGSDMHRGVTRTPEDTWMFQSGVNNIWANSNPGTSYVDFSMSHRMDPRAANWNRYESRFRPFLEYDSYVERQANLGLIKRDIDPFQMVMARNEEIKNYQFKDNNLFRFLNPGLWGYYRGKGLIQRLGGAAQHIDQFFRGHATSTCTSRGGSMAMHNRRAAFGTGARWVGHHVSNYVQKKSLAFRKHIRYCGCGSPMVAGGECPACSRKVRCPHCGSLSDPTSNHLCNYGLQRNMMMDKLTGDRNVWDDIQKKWIWRRAA